MARNILPSQNLINEAIDLYELDGWTLTDIANHLGTSATTVRKWLIKSDVSLRSLSESQLNRVSWKKCRACNKEFQPAGNRQLTCWVCTPDKGWMHRYRRYGLTKPVYDEIMKKQNGLCPLCLEPLVLGPNECVDHCHNTLIVRGVLCRGCNMVVSRFEDEGYVARVANYLKGGNHCA